MKTYTVEIEVLETYLVEANSEDEAMTEAEYLFNMIFNRPEHEIVSIVAEEQEKGIITSGGTTPPVPPPTQEEREHMADMVAWFQKTIAEEKKNNQ